MAVSVTHSTAADGTFSASGATAWDAGHTVSGLGTLATQNGTFSGTSSGTNTGDQTITLTGDATGSGTGSFAATLATVNSNVGSFTNASFTVNAKGLVTAASNGAGGGAAGAGYFKVDRNAVNQTVTAATFSKILFTTERVDSSNWFDNATNYRYTPQTAGWYVFHLNVYCTGGTTSGDTAIAAIYKNGALAAESGYIASGGSGWTDSIVSCNVLLQMNGSTDYVEGWCYPGGTSVTVVGGVAYTYMHGFQIA